MRNIYKQAERGREIIKDNRDLTMSEYQAFNDLVKAGHADDAILKAFYMGVAVGVAQTEA